MRKGMLVLAALLAAGVASPALADCKSDLGQLKARLARESDKAVKDAVKKHVERAEKELKGSESECRNAVTRGWRTYHEASAYTDQKARQATADRNVPLNSRVRRDQ
jgi:hypothetical protein